MAGISVEYLLKSNFIKSKIGRLDDALYCYGLWTCDLECVMHVCSESMNQGSYVYADFLVSFMQLTLKGYVNTLHRPFV